MCGSTAAQDNLAEEQTQAYQQAQQMTAEQYADQKAIYAPMAALFQSILSKGPSQTGFSTPEVQDLNASAVEGTAENYRSAATAVNEGLASEGGGMSPLTTGAAAELKGQVANSSAAEESNEESQIKEANYQQGFNEWQNAGAGLETIASGENPVGYETAETGAGAAAGTTDNQIAQEQNSWVNAIAGAVGTAAGGWATGGFKV